MGGAPKSQCEGAKAKGDMIHWGPFLIFFPKHPHAESSPSSLTGRCRCSGSTYEPCSEDRVTSVGELLISSPHSLAIEHDINKKVGCGEPLIFQDLFIKAANLTLKVKL